jgi:hypothetical protein
MKQMKWLTKNPANTKITRLTVFMALLIFVFVGCNVDNDNPRSPKLSITTVVAGLAGPMGIATDSHGNIWVSESGTDKPDAKGDTHNDNGKVIVITPSGKKVDAITHLSSYANVHSQQLQGTVHILLDKDKGMLYVLSGDYLYRADISHFKPGDQPIDARTLPREDIASVISKIPSKNNPEHDSHPYNLTIGPDGDLYIADAGANAIVRRKGVNEYSIFAEIPLLPNPSKIGGPTIQPVPTSIWYYKNNFYVTTLTGFPFLPRQSIIYKISTSGQVSVFQKGFTMIVDQSGSDFDNHVIVQYASSFNLKTEYAPNSGTLVWDNETSHKILADSLNQPTSITQVNKHTWYVTSLGDGSVLKVSYK